MSKYNIEYALRIRLDVYQPSQTLYRDLSQASAVAESRKTVFARGLATLTKLSGASSRIVSALECGGVPYDMRETNRLTLDEAIRSSKDDLAVLKTSMNEDGEALKTNDEMEEFRAPGRLEDLTPSRPDCQIRFILPPQR